MLSELRKVLLAAAPLLGALPGCGSPTSVTDGGAAVLAGGSDASTPLPIPTPTSTTSEITLLSLAQAAPLSTGLYKRPSVYATTSNTRTSGAIGSCNWDYEDALRGTLCVQNQRVGAEMIQIGLINANLSAFNLGWLLFQWGFDPLRMGTGPLYGSYPSDSDQFHSVSFYDEAINRAAIVMSLVSSTTYRDQIATIEPLSRAISDYLAFGSVPTESAQGGNWTHRDYALGATLQEASVLEGSSRWTAVAEQYIEFGLSRQLSDGTNPERNTTAGTYGFDVDYQSAGIRYAARFYATSSNSSLKARVKVMIQKALDKEIDYIDPISAKIYGFDSTRTCHEFSNNGAPKVPQAQEITEAFAYGYVITGDARYLQTAQLISDHAGWGSGGAITTLGDCNPH